MGKATGFMEYDRQVNPSVEPLERIRNFREFHPAYRRKNAVCRAHGVWTVACRFANRGYLSAARLRAAHSTT